MLSIVGGIVYAQFPTRESPFPHVTALVPEWSGFLVHVDEWNFGGILFTASPEALEVRFIGAQIGERFVSGSVKDEWASVVPVGTQIRVDQLDRQEWLHRLLVKRQAGIVDRWLTEDMMQKFEQEHSTICQNMYEILYELAEAGERIEGIVAIIPSQPLSPGETIVIELVFEVRERHNPTQRHQVTVPTSVTGLFPLGIEIKGDSAWIAGDLHIHSLYSDGDFNLFHLRDTNPNMRGRGYNFVYMADHVGYRPPSPHPQHLHRTVNLCPIGAGFPPPCNAARTWDCYVTNTQRVTLPEIAFFPGVEINLAHTTLSNTAPEGHALIYGLTSLVRSDGTLLFCGEITAANLLTLRPTGSSLGIAHPANTGAGMQWVMSSRGYYGAEVMAPGPFDELGWWRDRAFTPEALADAVAGRPVLSVRTGSDFHRPITGLPFYQAYTFVHIPITLTQWQSETWSQRRARVDAALRAGRTVASRHGSLARLTVNSNLPGSVIRNIPANSALTFNVQLRPFRTNPYRIRIFQNSGTVVVDHWVNGVANHLISINFSGTFPGTTHGYWLMVEEGNFGSEIIYSTPAIVTSQP